MEDFVENALRGGFGMIEMKMVLMRYGKKDQRIDPKKGLKWCSLPIYLAPVYLFINEKC